MANKSASKIIYNGQTLIDLTGDDVLQSDVLKGKKFHLKNGEQATGTCAYDADTSDATAAAAEILATKTAYKKGEKITGSMPNRGAQNASISTKDGTVTIQQGYHDGSGKVGIDATEKAKMIPANIRQGITLMGVEGNMSGSEDVKATKATITPYTTAQTILPSDLGDFNSINEIEVAAIAYSEVANDAGGLTVTIGTVAPAA